MPYILDGKSISPDAPFTHDGIQYPAGWIRRVSEDSRQSIGLFWQADPPMHDQRFWWGYDQAGALIPKDLISSRILGLHRSNTMQGSF